MAAVKIEKGSKEWHMFTDFWRLCQDYWIPEMTDDYWHEMIKAATEYGKKYDDPLCTRLAVAFLHAQEEKAKTL